MGSLFMIHLNESPQGGYRAIQEAREKDKAWPWLFEYLLNHGVVMNAQGMGCLSTVMDEAIVDQLAETFLAGLRALPKELLAGT
jgi:hypothetical protein